MQISRALAQKLKHLVLLEVAGWKVQQNLKEMLWLCHVITDGYSFIRRTRGGNTLWKEGAWTKAYSLEADVFKFKGFRSSAIFYFSLYGLFLNNLFHSRGVNTGIDRVVLSLYIYFDLIMDHQNCTLNLTHGPIWIFNQNFIYVFNFKFIFQLELAYNIILISGQ